MDTIIIQVQVDSLGKQFDFYVFNPLMTKEAKQLSGQPHRCSLGHAKGSSLVEMHWPRPRLNL